MTPGSVIFVGAVHEAAPALGALLASPAARVAAVVTPTEEASRGLAGPVDLATPAAREGVPLIRTEDINDPRLVAVLSQLEPDLLVVCGWTRLLRTPVLSVPRYGVVGFHASMLPRHRGRAPVNWAVIKGERRTGNTMMLLDPRADLGDIVDQRPIPIGLEDTCATVYERVGEAGADMLRQHLPALLTGRAPRVAQDPQEGDLLPRRTPAMGVLDWDRSASAVHDWVRALTWPYPGAFTSYRGERVMVWHTTPPGGRRQVGPPGTVLALEPDGVRIATGDGSIVVTRLSGPGEPPRGAAQWCREHRIGAGARLDAVPPETARWARGEGSLPLMHPIGLQASPA